MRSYLAAAAAIFTIATGAQAQTTSETGGGAPFAQAQPSMAVSQLMTFNGAFPSRSDGTPGDGPATRTIGMMRSFGGDYAFAQSVSASGQLLTIAGNTAQFAVLGTSFGGNGKTNFAVPDLRGAVTIGAGQGSGLSNYRIGDSSGSAMTALTVSQIPRHTHAIDIDPGFAGPAGGSQPFGNLQPSLAMTYLIAAESSGIAGAPILGQVSAFAGSFAPGGWLPANGQILSIAEWATLYSAIGTTFGGDGVTTFALPDLRGRTVVGAGADGLALGGLFGTESVTLTVGQMPLHDHDGGVVGVDPAGGTNPFDNAQPSIGLNYLVATTGELPSPTSSDAGSTLIGEIIASAADLTPSGYLIADGRILAIADYSGLFDVYGTRFGGDGISTFALPDLRGRTLVGASESLAVGTLFGGRQTLLTTANLPAHAHSIPEVLSAVPEPTSWTMLIVGFGLIGSAVRRRGAIQGRAVPA